MSDTHGAGRWKKISKTIARLHEMLVGPDVAAKKLSAIKRCSESQPSTVVYLNKWNNIWTTELKPPTLYHLHTRPIFSPSLYANPGPHRTSRHVGCPAESRWPPETARRFLVSSIPVESNRYAEKSVDFSSDSPLVGFWSSVYVQKIGFGMVWIYTVFFHRLFMLLCCFIPCFKTQPLVPELWPPHSGSNAPQICREILAAAISSLHQAGKRGHVCLQHVKHRITLERTNNTN